jgi:hypothetical protein
MNVRIIKKKAVPHRFQAAEAGNSSLLLLLFGDPYDAKHSVQSFHLDPHIENLLSITDQ